MRCSICRWAISRAEDTGTTPPRWVERHVRRCAACDKFARETASLSSRLRSERSVWLEAVPGSPAVRALDLEAAGPATRAAGSGRDRSRRFRWTLRPLPAAAAALVLVGAALVLFLPGRREALPSAEERAAARAAIKRLAAAPDALLPGVIKGAESSLERERRVLESSLASAAEYLQARLNIRIERREPPAKAS